MFEDSLEDKAKDAGILKDGASPDPQELELSPAQKLQEEWKNLFMTK